MVHIGFYFMLMMLIYWEENSKAWLVSSMEIEVNGDKTNYTVMSRDQNAGRSHSIEIGSSSCEWVEQFK